MNKKLFSVIALSLLIFTACGKSDPSPEADTDPTQDKTLLMEATSGKDLNKCQGIEDSKVRANCITTVQTVIDDEKEKANQTKIFDKENELSQQLYAKDDLNGCDKIGNENFRTQCRNNILKQRALNQNDATICSQIEDQESRESCISQLDQSK